MKTYEYKTVKCSELLKRDSQRLDTYKLNELGYEGWELVLIGSGEFVFKRECRKRRIVEV